MRAAAGLLLSLWSMAVSATAQTISCNSLPNTFMLTMEGTQSLGIDLAGEPGPTTYICQAQGDRSDTYTVVTYWTDYSASDPPPGGLPMSGRLVVTAVCTVNDMWALANATVDNSVSSLTLRRDCYTCGVEYSSTGYCACE